jgi:hypothetical protein
VLWAGLPSHVIASNGLDSEWRESISHRCGLCLVILLLHEFLTSCSPAVPRALPPEDYNGPRAEQPIFQQGDFWIYEAGNAARTKTTGLYPNLDFPLWIGKTWNYETEVRRAYLPPSSMGSPLRGQVDCAVKAVDKLTVKAGTFEAFRCECDCELLIGEGQYQSGCGTWTMWYAPDVKNVIQTQTASTSSSVELIQYKISRAGAGTKIAP